MFLLLTLALLAGCAPPGTAAGADPDETPGTTPRPAMAELLGRLPASAEGMVRGGAVDAPGLGHEALTVDYATPTRTVAAQVSIFDRGLPGVNAARLSAELDGTVRDATGLSRETTGRSFQEVSRATYPTPVGGPLRCALLEGRFGRSPVQRQLCLASAGGRFLRVQVTTVGEGDASVDAVRFTQAITAALRS